MTIPAPPGAKQITHRLTLSFGERQAVIIALMKLLDPTYSAPLDEHDIQRIRSAIEKLRAAPEGRT
jgi:hypothetical protein